MQVFIQFMGVIIPLTLLWYILWFRGAWWRMCVRQVRQANTETLIIYQDILAWLRLSQPVIIPACRLSKLLVTPRCLCFFTGPYKVAEIWMLKWQVDIIANVVSQKCPQATIAYQQSYPAALLNKEEHSYFGLRIASFSGGMYPEVLDEQPDLPFLFASFPEPDLPHIQMTHKHGSAQAALQLPGEEANPDSNRKTAVDCDYPDSA